VRALSSFLEVWGGHECTLSRVRDRHRDQTVLSGHQARDDDLDAFASLGLKALRYPLLWERIEKERGRCDWRWTDARLARARKLNLRLIAGLCHHGAGPGYVDLLSPDFAPGLARHARRAARRYPWIMDWTPVNEPLTTARFAALYGHWHPHLRDERAFWLALLNQIDAVRLAMHQIRTIIPDARLIQTEDLGRTYATAELQDQAEHDNGRRWMSWDLLFGRVTPGHPFWERLSRFGFGDRLEAIAASPSPPSIIGINHYLTSDRFLDHRCADYPELAPGGNGVQSYVDIEAIRIVDPAPAGLAGAIEEAWTRYRAPLALTEVHNACTRDEQVRWFARAWAEATAARGRGVDIRAVTAWSLLGAYDWDSLLTKERGHYEPGAFDVSSGERRETALAAYLRALSRDAAARSPVSGQGWWERDTRFAYEPARISVDAPPARRRSAGDRRPILIAGASGTLGQALARACAWRDLAHVLTSRTEMSLDDDGQIARAIERYRPRAVINATGFVRVDDAELEADACRRANTEAAVRLARICAERGVLSVTFSSDLVFDGASHAPYLETDRPNPLNVYGQSKAAAERDIEALAARALVVRTAAFFSPFDPHNFAAWVVRELKCGRAVECAEDAIVSPTYVPQLADAVLDLLLDGESGLWHLANVGALSWADFARAIAEAMELDRDGVNGMPRATLPWRAARPANSALGSKRGRLVGDLDQAIWRFARESPRATSAHI
jgi:dTDP-4-dehydrorhamnose reductase